MATHMLPEHASNAPSYRSVAVLRVEVTSDPILALTGLDPRSTSVPKEVRLQGPHHSTAPHRLES